MMPPSIAMLYSQNPEICAAELDGEICLFNPSTADYLNLNASASAIWNLIAQAKCEDEIVVELLERFDVTESECRQDTREILGQATQQGMVEVHNP
jgi:hypothetical protein